VPKTQATHFAKDFQIDGRTVPLPLISLTEGLLSFALRVKRFDLDVDSYLKQEGWPNFANFAREVKKYYSERMTSSSFVKVLDEDRVRLNKVWSQISSDEQRVLYQIAQDLDQNPNLLK